MNNIILIATLLAVFMVPGDISGIAIALPYIEKAFSENQILLQWVVNAFNLLFACFTLIWGALSDRFGVKKCFLIGITLYLFGSIFSAFSPSLIILDIFRGISGIGGASIFVCGSSLLNKTFSEKKDKLKAFAMFGTTAGLGITFGPTISGFLIGIFSGFRAIFITHFIILLLSLILSLYSIPNDEKSNIKINFDILGSLFFIIFMFSLILFITKLSDIKNSFIIAAIFIVFGFIFLLYEIRLYKRNEILLIDFSLLKNNRFLAVSFIPIIAGFTFVVLLTYFPTFLNQVFGLKPFQTGIYMLALTIPMLFCPILASKLLNKGIDYKKLCIIMCAMMSLGLLFLGIITFLNSNIFIAIIFLFIIGVGMGLHAGAIDGIALSLVEEDKTGLAAGILNTFRLGSETTGVALYGSLMSLFKTDYYINSFLYTSIILSLIGIILSIFVCILLNIRD